MTRNLIFLLCFLASAGLFAAGDQPVGIFESQSDVGVTPQSGKAEFDAAKGEYRVTGGGANMWLDKDAFHYVWKKVSGDVTLTADVQFVGTSAAGHRKAALVIRQSLEPGSAYADAALHGDGLTSLQYRTEDGGTTQEVRSELKGPSRIRIERRGGQFTLYAGNPGDPLTPSGPVTIVLHDPVYVGLGVCSHNADTLETAVFSNVTLENK